MSLGIEIRNRQRRWSVDVERLRGLTEVLLSRELAFREASLGIQLIGARAMSALNWRWLRHKGSTDILTFDHRSGPTEPLHGELFICVDEAVAQAEVFRTTAAGELVRYVVHGILHLMGHDDLEPDARRAMKRLENRLVRRMCRDGVETGLVTLRRRSVGRRSKPGPGGRGGAGMPGKRRL